MGPRRDLRGGVVVVDDVDDVDGLRRDGGAGGCLSFGSGRVGLVMQLPHAGRRHASMSHAPRTALRA
jgi:hypothetical protein